MFAGRRREGGVLHKAKEEACSRRCGDYCAAQAKEASKANAAKDKATILAEKNAERERLSQLKAQAEAPQEGEGGCPQGWLEPLRDRVLVRRRATPRLPAAPEAYSGARARRAW